MRSVSCYVQQVARPERFNGGICKGEQREKGERWQLAKGLRDFIEAPIRADRSLGAWKDAPFRYHQTQGDEHGTAATLMAAIDGWQISRPDEPKDFGRTSFHWLRAATAGYCARPIFKVHLVAPSQNWSFPQASKVVRANNSLACGRCEAVDWHPWSGD